MWSAMFRSRADSGRAIRENMASNARRSGVVNQNPVRDERVGIPDREIIDTCGSVERDDADTRYRVPPYVGGPQGPEELQAGGDEFDPVKDGPDIQSNSVRQHGITRF